VVACCKTDNKPIKKNQINNLSTGDNYGTLADNINNFFYSVSADLAPLDLSLMPAATDPRNPVDV